MHLLKEVGTSGSRSSAASHKRIRAVSGFQSAEILEKALNYLGAGATDEQIAAHHKTMQQTGQGSSHIRLLLNIDWNKL